MSQKPPRSYSFTHIESVTGRTEIVSLLFPSFPSSGSPLPLSAFNFHSQICIKTSPLTYSLNHYASFASNLNELCNLESQLFYSSIHTHTHARSHTCWNSLVSLSFLYPLFSNHMAQKKTENCVSTSWIDGHWRRKRSFVHVSPELGSYRLWAEIQLAEET